jgi:queuine/archaeosine tRNA-ribosyltransferase
MTDEPTAGRLLTLHNLAWLQGLVVDTRRAIEVGSFGALHRAVLDIWG